MWLPTIVAPTGEPTTAKRSADVVIAPTSRKAAMSRRPRQLSTKSPPHQGLIHLVDREKQRQRGEHHLLWPARVAEGIDANGPDDHTGGEVGLRREAHQVAPRSRLIATPRRSRAPFVMTAAGPRVTTAAVPHDARRQR